MPAIHVEVELHPQRRQEGPQRLGRHLHHPAASLAHQVLVVVVGEVEDRRAVGQVGVVDDAQLLEGVEGPVDGGDVHRREAAVHLGGDVLGRDVRLGGEEGFEDGLPGRCPAHPVGREPVEDGGHPGVR